MHSKAPTACQPSFPPKSCFGFNGESTHLSCLPSIFQLLDWLFVVPASLAPYSAGEHTIGITTDCNSNTSFDEPFGKRSESQMERGLARVWLEAVNAELSRMSNDVSEEGPSTCVGGTNGNEKIMKFPCANGWCKENGQPFTSENMYTKMDQVTPT
ncbi:unnamed protein product [Protopolystoma xenopodis]|uniref:Uncharacterized protein n=1 Tax=Protopolystoma xenopodis TaxID=117903 RepID=A0A448X268_9PLAT|nr:unnamed protein product [Protopolystoma xenopodis]